MSVYQGSRRHVLFRRAGLSRQVTGYLRMERRAIEQMLLKSDALIEVGCGRGETVAAAIRLRIDYLGLDPSPSLISDAKSRLHGESIQFINGEVEDYGTWSRAIKRCWKSPVLLMPYNCLGNVADPVKALQALSHFSGNMLISVFTDSEDATNARATYYQRAGLNVATCHSRWGIQFRGPGFASVGFRPQVLLSAANKAGLGLKLVRFGKIGVGLIRAKGLAQ